MMGPVETETLETARRFLVEAGQSYSIRNALLFGSRARSDHNPESDADIAVILRGAPGVRSKVAMDMAAIAFEIMLETGILVEGLPLWEDEFDAPETFSNPNLVRAIRRDGVPL